MSLTGLKSRGQQDCSPFGGTGLLQYLGLQSLTSSSKLAVGDLLLMSLIYSSGFFFFHL